MLANLSVRSELFHTAGGTAFADIAIDGHRETWPIRGARLRYWLRRQYYEVTGGEVMFEGRNMVGCRPHVLCKAGVGRTFQIMRPFPRMSVRDNVRVGAYVRAAGEDEARRLADDAVNRVGLGPVAGKMAAELTTKELRLMEIARALAGKPRLLQLRESGHMRLACPPIK